MTGFARKLAAPQAEQELAGRAGRTRWETFHLAELRQILQRNYRASTVMAVAGVSMGGLGALAYAARHRGLFRAAASFGGIHPALGTETNN